MFALSGFSIATFLALLGGMLCHALIQFQAARRNAAGVTLEVYVGENWPETVIGVIASLVLWWALPEVAETFPEFAAFIKLGAAVGMLSSFACGFIGNAFADVVGGRAAAIGGNPRQGGFARFGVLPVLALFAAAAIALAGCAGTRAAYQAAESLDDTAYVITEHYAAVVKAAADLREQGVLTGNELARAQAADRKIAPLIDALQRAVENHAAIQNAATAAELQEAIDAAVLELVDFINAVKSR